MSPPATSPKALPERLRPWAAHLALFPADLSLALGACVTRLAEVFGAWALPGGGARGEPQGYDGLTRRGSPERLLLSEWLLATEAPDEFLRRAAFGEQAYLRPAFHEPRAERRCVVLLDAGPEQVGAPRVAHLALLVVLARRAEAAGAGFAWGVLQASVGQGPATEVDAPSLSRWLKHPRAEPPTARGLAAWREALGRTQAADEVWLVGGARLARLAEAEGLGGVEVEEPLEPESRRLAVRVRPVAGSARRVVLELPPAPVCVRLLRDPFAQPLTPLVSPGPERVRSLRFSASGQRLLVSYVDGSVAALVLPRSPRATVPRARRFLPPAGEQVVACGWRERGGLLVLTRREDTLHLHGQLQGSASRTRSWELDASSSLSLPTGGEPPLWASSWRKPKEYDEVPLVLDSEGRLFSLPMPPARASTPARASPELLAENVLALAQVDHQCFLLDFPPPPSPTHGRNKPRLRSLQGESGGDLSFVWELTEARFGPAFSGAREPGTPPRGPLLAVCEKDGRWWVLRDPIGSPVSGMSLDAVPRGRVVGPLYGSDGKSVVLVMISEDQHTLLRWTHSGLEPITRASSRIRSACLSHSVPVLAWLTEAGEVCMWNLEQQALVFRSLPGGPT